MKIRMRGQSIRLRLGQSEVARLATGEPLTETIVFGPDSRFAVSLHPDPTIPAITLTAVACAIALRVPAQQLKDWATTDAVGFTADLPVGDDLSLRVLVEKDFQCLDNPAEDPTTDDGRADAYPNPSAVCS